jgi:acyl-CoA dehydrogenase
MIENGFKDIHQQMRATVSKFVEREILPYIDQWEEEGIFPRELYQKAGEAGILGVGFPEEYGGSGEDVFMSIVCGEELMKGTSGGLVASLGSIGIALPPIAKWGSEAMKGRIIPDIVAGKKISALAITEPGAGSDVANIRTKAVREGDYYRVNGSKMFITSGIRADYFTVAVRTGEEGYGGVSVLLIEKGMEGFSTGRNLKKMGWWASDTAELFFEDVMVPVENLIGEENQGFVCLMTNFAMERLSICVMANMTSQLALDACMTYVQERQAFGKPLAGFQVIRHKLAEMATQLEASRRFTYSVAEQIAAGDSAIKEIAMAKNFATSVSDKVTHEAVQIFGGMGFMRESVVERLYRDNRILSIGGGTVEIMNEVISKQMKL